MADRLHKIKSFIVFAWAESSAMPWAWMEHRGIRDKASRNRTGDRNLCRVQAADFALSLHSSCKRRAARADGRGAGRRRAASSLSSNQIWAGFWRKWTRVDKEGRTGEAEKDGQGH